MGIINPNLMTGKQRMEEIASILAAGIFRLRKRQNANNSMDFRTVGSVHAETCEQRDFTDDEQYISAACEPANHDGR